MIKFTGITVAPQEPEAILEIAKSWDMKRCIIVGEDSNGDLVFGGSFSESDKMNWLLDAAKRQLFDSTYTVQR